MVNNHPHWRQGQVPHYNNYSFPPNQRIPLNERPISQLESFPSQLTSMQSSRAIEPSLRPTVHQPILYRPPVSYSRQPTELPRNLPSDPRHQGHNPSSSHEDLRKKFENKIEVYNQFVEILTDFNSQRITTPRVIERTISLLEGHPDMILGFNTFLPTGYRILPSLDPNLPNDFRVVLPGRGETPISVLNRDDLRSNYPNGSHTKRSSNGSNSLRKEVGFPSSSNRLSPTPQHGVFRQNPSHQEGSKESDINDFERAVNHINRVKTFFNREPEKYSLFLSYILRLQHETSSPEQIFELVQKLLGSDSDIFKEFCSFLPGFKNLPSEAKENYLFSLQQPGKSDTSPKSHKNYSTDSRVPVDSINSEVVAASNHSSVPVISQSVNGSRALPNFGSNDNSSIMRSKNSCAQETDLKLETFSPTTGGAAKKRRINGDKSGSLVNSRKLKPHSLIYSENSDLYHDEQQAVIDILYQKQAKALAPPFAILQFDNIRKHINCDSIYNEFLKIINIYSQEVIESEALFTAAENFIGNNPKLFQWFKDFVGPDTTDTNNPNLSTPKPKPDLTLFRAFGPSYRQLPKSEIMIKCSGRDELCHEVLNDEFASHPTWASEETVFVAHKKNIYEENLHKSEEDRYELDYNMETNAHTISLLEPISRKISKMSAAEAKAFKLPPGLGGSSLTIYRKAIQQVYDNEAAKVLDLLSNSPATSVSVVLKRLKQKDQEWHENKKEWSKIWREVDFKNYYRSLDYQTTQFKCSDRKSLNPRYMVTEIEALKAERDELDRRNTVSPRSASLGNVHLFFPIHDLDVHKDAAKVILSLLKCHTGLSFSERKKVASFLKSFISDMFNTEFMGNFNAQNMEDTKREDSEDSYSSSGNESLVVKPNGRVTRSKQPSQGLSPKTQNISLGDDVPSYKTPPKIETAVSCPSSTSKDPDLPSSWIKTEIGEALVTASYRHPIQLMLICNCHVFAILRFYQILYSRLKEIKDKSAQANSRLHSLFSKKSAFKELELQPRFEALADIDFSKADSYTEFLNLTQRFILSEIDQATYEDCLRFIFGNHVFNIFTIDKIIGGLCKQVHMLFLEPNKNSLELIKAFQSLVHSSPKNVSMQQLVDYQANVQSLFSIDESVFAIEYSSIEKCLSIQLFDYEELNPLYFSTLQKKWMTYTENFRQLTSTPGITANKRPFLRRSLKSSSLSTDLRFRIYPYSKPTGCPRSFRIKWLQPNSSEGFIRRTTSSNLSPARSSRSSSWNRLLQGPSGWSRNLSNSSEHESNYSSWITNKEGISLLRPVNITGTPQDTQDTPKSTNVSTVLS